MSYSINAEERKTGTSIAIRADKKIPGVLYGPEIESVPISVDYVEFEKLYGRAGESTLVDLAVKGQNSLKVLIQDIQYDPVKRTMIHIDFRQIKMGEEMHATIEFNFVGEAPAVKTLGGTLNTSLRSVNVKCLPKDLVGSIDVDLSKLETFESGIRLGDLVLPNGLIVIDNPDTLIANVAAPLSEEQLKAREEADEGDVAAIKVEGEEGEVPKAETSEKKGDGAAKKEGSGS